jgi:hypothetical protein
VGRRHAETLNPFGVRPGGKLCHPPVPYQCFNGHPLGQGGHLSALGPTRNNALRFDWASWEVTLPSRGRHSGQQGAERFPGWLKPQFGDTRPPFRSVSNS